MRLARVTICCFHLPFSLFRQLQLGVCVELLTELSVILRRITLSAHKIGAEIARGVSYHVHETATATRVGVRGIAVVSGAWGVGCGAAAARVVLKWLLLIQIGLLVQIIGLRSRIDGLVAADDELVSGRWREESELGDDLRRTRWTAEQAA